MEIGECGQLPLPPINGSSHSSNRGPARECAVVTLDRAANVTSWNAEAEELFGCLAETAIGRPFYHFLNLESVTLENIEWELQTAYYRGRATCIRQYMRQDGFQFRAAAEIVPLWDGEFLGYTIRFGARDLS